LKRVTKFGDKKKDVSNKEHPQPVASFVAENQTTCLKDKKIVGFEIKGKQFLRFEQMDSFCQPIVIPPHRINLQ
jgi:hypothetical protein